MGMAASQARLLSITARIHDIEYQSQSIQNAKMQLATKSDGVYREYMDALDAQTVTLTAINNGERSTVAATFNNLCSRNRLTPASSNTTYALRDVRGRLIVEDEIAENYYRYIEGEDSPSAQGFAMFMMCCEGGALGNVGEVEANLRAAENDAWDELHPENGSKASEKLEKLHNSLSEMTKEEDSSTPGDIYNRSAVNPEDQEKYDRLLKEYREELYRSHMPEVITALGNTPVGADSIMFDPTDDAQKAEFEYYVSIFNQIQANGGLCIGIGKFDGFNGDASSDSEWLTAMIQCGQISIELVKEDKNGKINFEGTAPSSDSSLRYTETTSIDSTAAKKAEAKYEHDLKEIEQKDKKFDLTLSKLETEHTALTTEYESVKKVIEDNIDRTFKIFS